MLVKEDYIDKDTPTGQMRIHRFYPDKERSPGIILFSEIYQVTAPMRRLSNFFSGHGYIVYVPEIYHEFEPLGEVFKYNKEDTERGNLYKNEKSVESFDSDTKVTIETLLADSNCSGSLGAFGVCLGGHLSFRAAMHKEIKVSVCAYGTNIHDSSLGKEGDDSLQRINEIGGELVMIWGRQDPHIPMSGRASIYQALEESNIYFSWHEFNAQHAFLRDEGERYDPALTTISLNIALESYLRVL
jgi:carboxymethylenebutenolidase